MCCDDCKDRLATLRRELADKSRALDALLLVNHTLEQRVAELEKKGTRIAIDAATVVVEAEELAKAWEAKAVRWEAEAVVSQRERLDSLQLSTQNVASEVEHWRETVEIFDRLWEHVGDEASEKPASARAIVEHAIAYVGSLERQHEAAVVFFDRLWDISTAGAAGEWTRARDVLDAVRLRIERETAGQLELAKDNEDLLDRLRYAELGTTDAPLEALEAIWLMCHPDRPQAWAGVDDVAIAVEGKVERARDELERALLERGEYKATLSRIWRLVHGDELPANWVNPVAILSRVEIDRRSIRRAYERERLFRRSADARATHAAQVLEGCSKAWAGLSREILTIERHAPASVIGDLRQRFEQALARQHAPVD